MHKRKKIINLLDDKLDFDIDVNKNFQEFEKKSCSDFNTKKNNSLFFKKKNFLAVSSITLLTCISVSSISAYFISKNVKEQFYIEYRERTMLNEANKHFEENGLNSVSFPETMYYVSSNYMLALYKTNKKNEDEYLSFYQIYTLIHIVVDIYVEFYQEEFLMRKTITENLTIDCLDSIEGIDMTNNRMTIDFHEDGHLVKNLKVLL